MRFLIIIAVLICMPVTHAAQAQNTIKIINEDGTITEFDLGDEAYKAVPVDRPPAKEEPVKEAPPFKRAVKPRPDPAPAPAPVQTQETEAVSTEELLAEPGSLQDEQADEPEKKQTKTETKAKTKTVKAAPPRKSGLPIPSRKPPLPDHLVAKQQAIPGIAISKNLATAIAIDNAPPSNGFRVQKGMHGDRPAYVVIFKTDSGPYPVYVDAETGDILKK